MLNHIEIMGRLVREPELRYTQTQKAVATFTVAVDDDYAPKGGAKNTQFIDCVAWDKKGEFVNSYFIKGSMAVVTGRLSFREWEDKSGNKRRNAEVTVENVYFAGENKSAKSSAPAAIAEPKMTPLPDVDESDLPF